MRSVNKVTLIGNLTRDPEIKQTGSGQTIVTFNLTTNREWITHTNEKKSLAEYHNIVAWGSLAETCQKFLKKGKLIYIEGYLKTRSWDSPEGTRIFKTEIVAHDMIMLDKRPKEDGENKDFDEFLPENDTSADNMFDPDAKVS